MTNTRNLTIQKPLLEYMHPNIVELLDEVVIPIELIELGGELYLRTQGLDVPNAGVVVIGAFKNHHPDNNKLLAIEGYNQVITISPDQMGDGFSSIFSDVIHANRSNPVAETADGRFVAFMN